MADNTYSGFPTYTFPRLADLVPVKRILVSTNLPTRNRDLSTSTPFLASIPMNAAPLGLIAYENSGFDCMVDAMQSLAVISFTFSDQDGRPLSFESPWTLTLEHRIFHNPALVQRALDLWRFLDAQPPIENDESHEYEQSIAD